MRILVCFKLTPDLDRVADSDWDSFTLGTDLTYAGRILNCFDESALEIALRCKEAMGGEPPRAHCTAVTVGPLPPAPVWQTLYAAGFDQVAVVEAPPWEFQPRWVAQQLAAFARAGGYDLILTGKQAGLADTATVPFQLAELLSLPTVGDVELVEPNGGQLSVTCVTGAGRERWSIAPPAVAVVGNSPVAALRAVTLKGRLAAAKRQVARAAPHGAPPADPAPQLLRERADTVCSFPSDTMDGFARLVATQYLKGGGPCAQQ